MNEEMKEKISDFLFIWIFILQPFVEGGICWSSISRSGNCKNMLMLNVTRDQCCSTKREPNVGWTPHDNPSSGLMFFWEYLSKGAPVCWRCHNSCNGVICPAKMKCKMKKARPRCVCKTKCSQEDRIRGPVCGTDMMKYKNICHLQRHNCKYETEIKVDYHGKCKDSCRNVRCPSGRFCVEDQNGLPHCINCSSDCTAATMEPVCGDNLQTYQSSCHLKAELCKNGIPVQIAYPGPCKVNATCPSIDCPHFMECLVNPVTRQPTCTNCRRHCSPLSIVPVCGSDGTSYKNFCAMRRKSCNMRVLIVTKHSGRCNRKRNKCRGCKLHLKRRFRQRRLRQRKLRQRMAKQYSKFKLKQYGGYSIFRNKMLKTENNKMDTHKEFG